MGRYVLVRVKGLEPPRPFGQQILSLPRLPFRHTRAVPQPCRQIYMARPNLPRGRAPSERVVRLGFFAKFGVNRGEPKKYLSRM